MTYRKPVLFLTGAILGATAVVLSTPISGRRVRRALRYKIEDCSDQLADVAKNVRNTSNQIRRQSERLVHNAGKMFRRSQLRAVGS
jgi:gas vesicle protein